MPQSNHVSLEHLVQGVQAAHSLQDMLNLGSAAVDKDLAVDTNVVLGKGVNEPILEECLRDSHEDRTAECLEELHTGRADGNHFLREHRLHDQHADLEAGPDAETSNDLVAEPLAEGGVDVKGGDHAGADGVEDHAGNDDKVVVADDGDEAARYDGAEDRGKQEREDFDAGLDGGYALDGLKVESYHGVSPSCAQLEQCM